MQDEAFQTQIRDFKETYWTAKLFAVKKMYPCLLYLGLMSTPFFGCLYILFDYSLLDY